MKQHLYEVAYIAAAFARDWAQEAKASPKDAAMVITDAYLVALQRLMDDPRNGNNSDKEKIGL